MRSKALLFVEIHLSTKNNRAKCIKKRHKWKISLSVFPRLLKKMSFFAAFAQNDFLKKWPKIMRRRPPTEISGYPIFFKRKFSQNDFGVGGPPISDLWPFFRFSIWKISTTSEKTFVANFFDTATKTTVLFFRGALIFLQKKLTNPTNFQFKFEVIRRCTLGVVQIHNRAFILT